MSTIATAVNAFKEHLVDHLGVPVLGVHVGQPARVEKILSTRDKGAYLDIFVYHVEHAGHPVGATKDEPVYVRLHCLVVPMSIAESDDELAAEMADLRLLGAVLAALHRHPRLRVEVEDGSDTLVDLQIVPVPMPMEEAHRIWSTHSEVSYRVSAAYELALLPVFVAPQPRPAPVVAEVGLELSFDGDGRPAEKVWWGPRVDRAEIDVSRPDWVPLIYLLDADHRLRQMLHVKKLPGETLPPARVLGFGTGSEHLSMERWNQEAGWVEVSATPAITLGGSLVDPDRRYDDTDALNRVVVLDLEGPGGLFDGPGQLWVRLRRVWKPEDGPEVTLTSNAVLITVQGGG